MLRKNMFACYFGTHAERYEKGTFPVCSLPAEIQHVKVENPFKCLKMSNSLAASWDEQKSHQGNEQIDSVAVLYCTVAVLLNIIDAKSLLNKPRSETYCHLINVLMYNLNVPT